MFSKGHMGTEQEVKDIKAPVPPVTAPDTPIPAITEFTSDGELAVIEAAFPAYRSMISLMAA
jgi:hypothetical protein